MKAMMALGVLLVLLGGLGVQRGVVGADARAQDCGDWVDLTYERVNAARTLLYPGDRPGAFEGSVDQAAQEMFILFEEQQASDPPDAAGQVNGDLVEAFSVAAEGLASGGPDAATQVVFAKAIVYNADVRLLSVVDTC